MTLLRKPGAALVTLLFLVMGAAFLTQVVPYRQILESQRRVESAQIQLQNLQDENEVLSADVAALQTDEEVERLAREKLGYVKPGETAYVVLDPPEDDGAPPPAVNTEPVVPRRTWVEQLWDFVTGGDLAD